MAKLTEFSTNELFDVLSNVTPYIEEIVSDKKLMKLLNDRVKATDDMTKEEIESLALEKGVEKILKIIPFILGKHKNAVLHIIAIINQTDFETVQNQKATVTIRQIRDMAQDKDLVEFFLSLKQ